MGYVGNQSTNAYSSLPAKQDFTGATGTSLTLSHAVAGPESIDLFINNVRQEPTTAYSVSDTTVTLTGSVVATDDIYVVYNGLALQTIVPPDGSVSTAKIADDAVTSAKLDTNIAITGDLTVDTNTLHVDSTNNRVGVGTTTPDSPLEVSVAGQANMKLTNSSASSELRFIADSSVCYIQTQTNHPLAFATNNGAEAMRVSGTSLVIGATSEYGVGTTFAQQGSNGTLAVFNQNYGNGFTSHQFRYNGSAVGSITISTSGTSYNTSSDHRLKENVTDITGATDRLKQLNPVRFNFIVDPDTTVDGFLAHEAQSVVPEAVTGTHNEVDDDGNAVMQGIDQSKLVPLLVATIQEQQTAIEALTARVTALEAE